MPRRTTVWPLRPLEPGVQQLRYRPSYQATQKEIKQGWVKIGELPELRNPSTGFRVERRPLKCYIYLPTEGDIQILKSCCPGATVEDPRWRTIEADLVSAGHSREEVQDYTAPILLRLLQKARQSARDAQVDRLWRAMGQLHQARQSVVIEETAADGLAATVPTHTATDGAAVTPQPDAEPGNKTDTVDDAEAEQEPALTEAERLTLSTLSNFDASELVSVVQIVDAMNLSERLSERTIKPAVRKLVQLGYAERPEGNRQGVRLTIRGRRLAVKFAP